MSKKILFLLLGFLVLLLSCEEKTEIENLFNEAEKLEADIINCVGSVSRCKENYEKILINAPESEFAAIACYKLGKLNEIFGHYDEAIEYYRKLASYYPENPFCADGLLNTGQIYQLHLDNVEAAQTAFQQVITLYSETPAAFQALLNQGMLRCENNQWASAIDNFQSIITKYPDHTICDDLAFRIADIQQSQMQDSASAAKSYQFIIENYPLSSWVKYSEERLGKLNLGGLKNEE